MKSLCFGGVQHLGQQEKDTGCLTSSLVGLDSDQPGLLPPVMGPCPLATLKSPEWQLHLLLSRSRQPQFLIYLTIGNGTTSFTAEVCGSHCLGSFFPATLRYHQGHSNLKSFGGYSVKGWLMLCRSWNLRLLWWGEGKGNREPNPTCATLTYCKIMVKQLKLSENQSVQLPLRKSLLLRVLLTTISKNRDQANLRRINCNRH